MKARGIDAKAIVIGVHKKRIDFINEKLEIESLNWSSNYKWARKYLEINKRGPAPQDFEDFIEEFNQRLCGAAISESTVKMLKNELLGNLNDMHWEEYITAFLDDPSNDNLSSIQWRFDNVLFRFFELSVYHIH